MRSTGSRQKRQRPQADDRPGIWVGYGKLVKLFRERAGLTQQELADAVGYSYEQVASIEQGRRAAKYAFTQAAESALPASGALTVLQDDVDLARLPLFFRSFALIETEAVSRFSCDPLLIPGLLQTEEYARALIRSHFPPLDDAVVEERVAARLKRQGLLTRNQPPVVLVFIIEEAALKRQVGGKAVLKAQLDQLLEASSKRNIEVQIMPTSIASHSGLGGSMVLVETLEREQLVYLESHDVGTVVSAPNDVSDFWMRYGMLRSQALNAEESARLVERMAGEL